MLNVSPRADHRKRSAPLPDVAPSPRPRPIVDGSLAYPNDLVLDGRLKFSTRMILGSMTRWLGPGQVAVWETDEAIAEAHGVSPRSARDALREGELGGWVARMSPQEYARWARQLGKPELYDRLPRPARVAKRLVVLLWSFPDRLEDLKLPSADPEDSCRDKPERNCRVGRPPRKVASGKMTPVGTDLPADPEPICHPSHAGASNFTSSREIRDDPPSSPPEKTPDFAGLSPTVRAGFLRLAEERQADPAAAVRETSFMKTFVPNVAIGGDGRKATAKPAKKLQVEKLVAACVGAGGEAALDALLLFLLDETREPNPERSRECWRKHLARELRTAVGYDWVVGLILALPDKPSPGRWLSTCLARGRPTDTEAHKATPGPTRQSYPGVARDRLSRPISKCIRGQSS